MPRTHVAHVATRAWQPNDKCNISALGEQSGRGLAALTSHQQSKDLCAPLSPVTPTLALMKKKQIICCSEKRDSAADISIRSDEQTSSADWIRRVSRRLEGKTRPMDFAVKGTSNSSVDLEAHFPPQTGAQEHTCTHTDLVEVSHC